MGFKSIILSKQNILQAFFFSLSFKQFCKLSRSNVFQHVVPRKGIGEEGAAGAVAGSKPHRKTHLAAMRPEPGTAADQIREFRFLLQAAEMEVPVWAIISGVIPILHSCCKATKCPRCEEVKMRSTQ